ncbi:hypothetical protein H072_6595 [Dactylellina haptotyla CBS 200.50]|uniref:CENP-V/GFA domain-containing protein n=1 Tax=Dactylellina haptotyla (strain CBS 200.50) TaxID=1284197 RepID=S8BJX2_DACHA|nr:hypothetical protein H072_6595 [Dactylellina haptotyla CBS 200.50]
MSRLKAACHCGANTFSIPTNGPLDLKHREIHICLCNVCRHQTGTLGGTWNVPHGAPFDPDSPPETLTKYQSSSVACRYFCNICYCKLFFRYEIPEYSSGPNRGFFIASGCVQLPAGDDFDIDSIIFVKDNIDGGCANWLAVEEMTASFVDPLTAEDIHALEATAMNQQADTGILEGKCHCSSVNFRISRATGKDEELPTLGSNTGLVVPHWMSKEEPLIDDKNPWWVREVQKPGKSNRFLGGMCACKSCRTIAGSELQGWVSIPTAYIEVVLPNGETVPWPTIEQLENDDKYKQIIETYRSTPGDVTRGFCKKCGANIFWDGLARGNLVDISAGLLTSRGVREEGWIEWWTEWVGCIEDATGRSDIPAQLEMGLKKWKQRIGGRV